MIVVAPLVVLRQSEELDISCRKHSSRETRAGAQWFSPLTYDVEIAGVGEKAISSLSGDLFHHPNSHEMVERSCHGRD